MEVFKHLILTRFNIAINYGATTRKNNIQLKTSCIEEEWLEKRFDLFEKYTLPRMRVQTEKNFTWLVFFHSDTPEKYKKRVQEYKTVMHNLVPVYMKPVDSKCHFDDYLYEYIKGQKEKWILTTRIDNDDLIAEDFTEKLQSAVKEMRKEECFLSFLWGINWDIRSGMTAYMQYPYNHFVSMLSLKAEKTRFVLQYTHTLIGETGIPVYTIGKTEKHRVRWNNTQILVTEAKRKPMWCEIIHETNYMNYMHYWPRGMVLDRKRLLGLGIIADTGIIYKIKYIVKAVRELAERRK